MQLHGNIINDRRSNHQRKLQYRQMLEEQIRENQRQKYQRQRKERFKTQPEIDNMNTVKMGRKMHPSLDRYQKHFTLDVANNGDNSVHSRRKSEGGYGKQRKFIEKSVFLPAVHKKYHKLKHGYERSASNQSRFNIYSNDSQAETIQALTQCEIILQNLKKLAKGQINSLNTITESNNYEPRNKQANYIRSPSFFRTLQSSAEQEVRLFRTKEPNMKNSQVKKKEITSNKNISGSGEKKLLFKSKEQNQNSNKKAFDTICSEGNQFQESIDAKRVRENSKSSNKSNEQNEVIDQKQKERLRKQHLELEKARKKQRFLLKYLQKAKSGGVKLHEKILHYKMKMEKKTIHQPKVTPQHTQLQQTPIKNGLNIESKIENVEESNRTNENKVQKEEVRNREQLTDSQADFDNRDSDLDQ